MQGHKKPARNYLGKQKTVKNIPIKWKSGPKAPETELAYITKAEKDLLLKKDLHGSLKHGPNTGPDGIMSLDSQGDYTRDRSQDRARSQMSRGDSERAVRQEARRKEVLTGQVDRGQTAAVSARTRRGAVPEWVTTPSGQRKYVGSAYKDTGRRGFLSRLFGGANKYGYGQTRGTGAGRFFDRKSSIKTRGTPGQRGFEYFSEDEDVGDIKPGWGGRILGGLAGLATGIPFVGPAIGGAIDKGKGIFGQTPRDMSQFNRLGLYNEPGLEDFEEEEYYTRDKTPMATTDRWTTPAVTGADQNFNNQNFNMALPMGSAEGGRIGYQGGELVEDASMMEATPAGMMEENIEEVQGEPSREQLEAIAFEIFRLPLEELDEQQLMVVYQAAMEQEPSEEEVQFAAQEGPPEGIASLV